jgi:hypothetical protein
MVLCLTQKTLRAFAGLCESSLYEFSFEQCPFHFLSPSDPACAPYGAWRSVGLAANLTRD